MTIVYKTAVVDALRNLADYQFQQLAWLASDGPVVSSFAEDVCQLFDDTGLGYALEKGESVFGQYADQALIELHEATKLVDEYRPVNIILDDPQMQVVREKAAHALSMIISS